MSNEQSFKAKKQVFQSHFVSLPIICEINSVWMKRFIVTFLAIISLFALSAQTQPKKRFIKSWHIDEQLAIADTVPVDTAHINYQDNNIIDRLSIANSYNGNYGSPIQSKIYIKRSQGSDFMFEDAYKPYLMDAQSAKFYDSSFPFTNLTYLTGGPVGRKEEHVKFLLAVSPSKKMNFGTNLDFLYSVGRFNNQAAQRFSGSVFWRYSGKHYSAYALAAVNNHFNHESGGLSNLEMLNNPDIDVETKDMPVNMHGYSVFRKNTFFYNHSYAIGINREIKVDEDSVRYEFVPVTRFGHSFKFEEMKKRYYEPTVVRDFYEFTDLGATNSANDTAAVRTLSNLFSVNLAEEFNRWMKFGLTGYVENEIQQFIYAQERDFMSQPTILMDSYLPIGQVVKSNTRVGGMMSKAQGANFRYNFLGDIYLIGYKLGEFRLEGKAVGNFKLGKEQASLTANAFVRNEEPSFFLQNYHSTHFRWSNHFTKMYKTHLGGVFELPKRKTKLHAAVENITNYIYFNEKGLPTQHSGNVQVFTVDLKQDVRLGVFNLENNVVYQVSSNQDVLPLPTLTLFHNLYYYDKWFVDLYPQIGVNVRYHTKYFAPSYMPAITQFFNQKEVEVGNFPEINAYANFHLKQARIFVKYNNIGRWFMKEWGFHMPGYPINPPMFKFGLSWNFYN